MTRPPPRAPGDAAILLGFLCASLLFVAGGADWRHTLFASSGGDDCTAVWLLDWWPRALLHGLDPLHTALVYAPAGYDLAWATPIPTAALLALPVTLLFGAAVSFNLLTTLAPGLDGFCAFLLLRGVGGGTAAALPGALFFAVSPYEVGQLQGHLNLDLTFPLPLLLLLAVRRATGALNRRRFVSGFTLLLLAEFGLSAELLATCCAFGAGAWLLALLSAADRSRRAALLSLGRDGLVALLLAALAAAPMLWDMARGASRIPGYLNLPADFSADLFNLALPTRLTWPGGGAFAALTARFGGNLAEQGACLGLPMLLVLLAASCRRGPARLPALLCWLILLASLGPVLHVAGRDTGIPLPWSVAARLPLLRAALPVRFALQAGLCAVIAAVLWQRDAPGARSRRLRLGALVLAVLAVLPTLPRRRDPIAPLPFFQPAALAGSLGADPTLLLLPYLTGAGGAPTRAMLWQWQSGMRFRQTGGFLSFVPDPDARSPLVQQLLHNRPGPEFGNDLAGYVAATGAVAVVAGPGSAPALLDALDRTGWRRQDTGGVRIFRAPPPAALRFARLDGEVWPDRDGWCWLGRRVVATTHGRGAVLHLDGAGLPIPDTLVELRSGGATTTFRIASQGVLDVPLPPDGRFEIVSHGWFRPGSAWHTPDIRTLSFRARLEPDP